VGALVDAAGGVDEFVERYAVVLLSDHGQTAVREVARLEEPYVGVDGVLVTASNRAGMVYRLDGCREAPRRLAERLDGWEPAQVVLFREPDGVCVARRDGAECAFAPDGEAVEVVGGDPTLLGDVPDGLLRSARALANPNAGDVLVSAAPGWELADLAGRHHRGGGSHGSLTAGDSDVPFVTVGVDGDARSIVDVARLALGHIGVEPPAYAAPLRLAV
jgi:hypothetical protein